MGKVLMGLIAAGLVAFIIIVIVWLVKSQKKPSSAAADNEVPALLPEGTCVMYT
jgi:hypothetical protein